MIKCNSNDIHLSKTLFTKQMIRSIFTFKEIKNQMSKGVEFKDVKVNTMVSIVHLNGKINLAAFFRLLQITRVDRSIDGNAVSSSYISYLPLQETYYNLSSIHKRQGEMPYLGYPGPIFHVGHVNHYRGIPRESEGHFKNSVTIDMSIFGKNANVRVSENTLHICGIKDINMAINTYDILKYNIDSIENVLNYMNNNVEHAKEIFQWIKDNSKGGMIYVAENTDVVIDSKDVYILDRKYTIKPKSDSYDKLMSCKHLGKRIIEKLKLQEEHYKSCKEDNVMPNNAYPIFVEAGHSIILTEKIPKHFDTIIYNFFIDKVEDFKMYENYIKTLELTLTIKSIYDDPMSINKILYVNINYGYNLGFHLNRSKFRDYVNKDDNFRAEYRTSGDSAVTVYLPLDAPPEVISEISRNKKNNKMFHKFIVYKTGSVTQSGPHPLINEQAYYKFMDLVKKGSDIFSVK